ncbi:MAG: aminoglycoside phosphotransferase family protein [Deltaproteobacteria bacterium]|nr:MAG: aminoglycoside phosphotransferase family protein [Deltaproteobacteria bacterium]
MEPGDALRHWGIDGELRVAEDGLINRTWLVADPQRPDRPVAVLQWVNPIFPLEVDLDIQAVSDHLLRQGMVSPRLWPLPGGSPSLPDDSGHWRLMDYIPGRTLHRLRTAGQAAAAGALLGRFHAAMADWDRPFARPPRRIHDTGARMADLDRAMRDTPAHPLLAEARPVGDAILDAWRRWDGDLDLPERACHGDPKISNLRFAADRDEGICLLDLDTVGPQRLADELGDAWRSWCNPAGEDDLEAVRFDLELFESSAAAWRRHAPAISPAEADSLVPGIERICLELAARFCADSLQSPTRFREDRKRFPVEGSHNLHRARVQLSLARQARHARAACAAILATGRPR